MKRQRTIALVLCMLFAMAFMAVSAQASAGPDGLAKPHETKTPGFKATQNAELHETQGKGKSEEKQSTAEADEDAKEPKNARKLHYRGTVTAADATSLTINLRNGPDTVSFVVTADTQVKIPTLWQCSTCSDLVPGVEVLVQAVQDDDGQLVALTVHVVPGKPTKVHRVGEVVDYVPGESITILAKDEQEYTFLLTAEAKILPAARAELLAPGAWVTVICPRDVTGQPATALGIVVHPAADEGTSGDDGAGDTNS